MAQWAKGLLLKHGDLSSIPGTHVKVKGQMIPQTCPLTSIRTHTHTHTSCTHIILIAKVMMIISCQAVGILRHALCVYEFVIRTKCIRVW